MKHRSLRSMAYLVLAATTLLNAGCLAVVAGVGAGAAVGCAYCQGKVCSAYNAGFDDTWAATRTALTELGMPVLSEEHESAGCGCIESRTADGERVRVHLDTMSSPFPAEGPITRVCVRVAVFGDHPVSVRVLDQVGMHLVAVPQAVQPGAPPGPPMPGPPRQLAPTASIPPQTEAPPLAN